MGNEEDDCKRITMPYGQTEVQFCLPRRCLLDIVEPQDAPSPLSESTLVRRALMQPYGSDRVAHLAAPGQETVIIVSDITRPCPTSGLLPPLLEELALAGVKDRDITIVFALGAHRRHSAQEQIQLVGQDVFRRIECIDSDTEDCVYLGETSRGTPVEIFRRVVEGEFLICLGNIDLHHFAGYSGGAKAILPGVSSVRSITANHVMWFQCNTAGAEAGKLEGNPVREDIEEAGQMVGLGFILNAIVDASGRVLDVVAGDPLAAHRQGCARVDARNKIPVSDYADIVVVSPGAYPKDISLFQAQKALDFAVCAVKEGGIIVLLAECREGIGDPVFEAWLRQAECPDGPLKRIREEFVLGGDKAAAVASVVSKTPIYLVSSLPRETVRECWRMPGLRHFRSVDAALEAAFARRGQDAHITIMPDGNSTLPVLDSTSGFVSGP